MIASGAGTHPRGSAWREVDFANVSLFSRTASVISRQQRDVNRLPDPVLKLTAVASWKGLWQTGGV
jgi:hypothetical protein